MILKNHLDKYCTAVFLNLGTARLRENIVKLQLYITIPLIHIALTHANKPH